MVKRCLCTWTSQNTENVLEFTEADLPRELTQPEVVAAKVREMFRRQNAGEDHRRRSRPEDELRNMQDSPASGSADEPAHLGDEKGLSALERPQTEVLMVDAETWCEAWADVLIDLACPQPSNEPPCLIQS